MRLILSSLVLALTGACAQPSASLVNGDDVAGHVAQVKAVGLEAAIVKQGRVVWSQGYGFADREAAKAPTADTVFRLASVSKIVTLTTLMRLYDQGKFQLDDDVSPVLGFTVRHPEYPDVPITYRMLLTHTAGIEDDDAKLAFAWNDDGDSPLALAALVEGYFKEGGAYYDAKANWRATKPGASYAYSNYGIALAGHLAARLAGTSFEAASRALVLEPLGMKETSWTGVGFQPIGGMAAPYGWDPKTSAFVRYGQYGYPDVPAGMARSSASQLARLVELYQSRGAPGGVRLLAPETVDKILADGLVLAHGPDGQVGHDGGDPGVATALYWRQGDPSGLGVVVLANTSPRTSAEEDAFQAVIDDLFRLGQELPEPAGNGL